MRILRTVLTAMALGLLLTGAAGAQTISSSAPRPVAVTTAPAAFPTLAAGDQRIARALFEAQSPLAMPDDAEATPLTLNEIAALHAGKSWDGVLKEMRAKHLISAASLRDVILRYEHPARGAGDGSGMVAVTTASGRTSIVGSTREKRGEAE